MIIYLAHPSGAIEACESATSAEACEARGYCRCTYAIHKKLWWRKDWRALSALRQAQPRLETAPLKAASGWKLYIDGKEIKQ